MPKNRSRSLKRTYRKEKFQRKGEDSYGRFEKETVLFTEEQVSGMEDTINSMTIRGERSASCSSIW